MKFTRVFRRAGTALLALATALLLPSCFESHSTVHLKKDGSGTIDIKMVFGAQMTEMLKMAEQQGGEAKNPLLDEKQLKSQTKKMGEGVEFVKVEELKLEDGKIGSIATYKFADIRKVKLEAGATPPGGPDAQEDPQATGKESIQFDFTPGDTAKLTIKMPSMDKEQAKPEAAKPKKADAGDEPMTDDGEPQTPDAKDDPQMQQMAKMFEGMKVAMDVEVDGTVSASTATNREGSKVTLMAMDMGKMMANADFAKKMKSPEDLQDITKFAAMAKELGMSFELKPEITVEFK